MRPPIRLRPIKWCRWHRPPSGSELCEAYPGQTPGAPPLDFGHIFPTLLLCVSCPQKYQTRGCRSIRAGLSVPVSALRSDPLILRCLSSSGDGLEEEMGFEVPGRPRIGLGPTQFGFLSTTLETLRSSPGTLSPVAARGSGRRSLVRGGRPSHRTSVCRVSSPRTRVLYCLSVGVVSLFSRLVRSGRRATTQPPLILGIALGADRAEERSASAWCALWRQSK